MLLNKSSTTTTNPTTNNIDNEDISPLQISISRNLSDKLYEKRKLGALEVENLIRSLNENKEEEKIRNVIQYLVNNFSDSSQGNSF